jgi:hypothetical protein
MTEKESIHVFPTRLFGAATTTKVFGATLLPARKLVSLAITDEGVKWFTDWDEQKGKIAPWDYIAGVFSFSDSHYFPLSYYKRLKKYEPITEPFSSTARHSSEAHCTIVLRCLHVKSLPYISPWIQAHYSYYVPPQEGAKRLSKISNKPRLKLRDFKFQVKNKKMARKIINCIQSHLNSLGRRKFPLLVLLTFFLLFSVYPERM